MKKQYTRTVGAVERERERERELYFRDAVWADASICSQKNNIKTFCKHKLDVVGVGVPDDPQTEQKYINIITSNVPTSNAAITLIALIITIIIMKSIILIFSIIL